MFKKIIVSHFAGAKTGIFPTVISPGFTDFSLLEIIHQSLDSHINKSVCLLWMLNSGQSKDTENEF